MNRPSSKKYHELPASYMIPFINTSTPYAPISKAQYEQRAQLPNAFGDYSFQLKKLDLELEEDLARPGSEKRQREPAWSQAFLDYHAQRYLKKPPLFDETLDSQLEEEDEEEKETETREERSSARKEDYGSLRSDYLSETTHRSHQRYHHVAPTCFKCGQEGHIARNCQAFL